MNIVELINKKKTGGELTTNELKWIIENFVSGNIKDYQMSSLLMAIYFKGLSNKELGDFTQAIIDSGDVVDLSDVEGICVDKHSTGGVGDTTSLVLVPLFVASGLKVAKMSGRGLGHTGGTIDKLEAFPGFSVEISQDRFVDIVNETGAAIIGQTKDIAYADKLLYALRDVTGTVDSIPLIASSIMAKKIAAGAETIALDVKYGSGAFMKTPEDAKKLAEAMIAIGREHNRRVIAFITNMSEPLSNSIGNTLEVIEAINVLNGKGNKQLRELCLGIASEVLVESNKFKNIVDAKKSLNNSISDGTALAALANLVKQQGGNPDDVFNPQNMKLADINHDVFIENSGYVAEINAEKFGQAIVTLGGGRRVKEDIIDHSTGIILNIKVGEKVVKGQKIATVYASNHETAIKASNEIINSIKVTNEKVEAVKIIEAIIK